MEKIEYTIRGLVGKGAMGEIYLAYGFFEVGPTRFLAIKKVASQFSESIEFRNMFRHEARVSQALNHENLIQVFDFIEDENELALVTEYVHGNNLRQLLNALKVTGGAFTVPAILFIVFNVAKAIEAYWKAQDENSKSLGIIKRDVSPNDILIGFDGRVKLVDMGIAKSALQTEFTEPGVMKGKFSYMSPEQSQGEELDIRSDLFSLGTIFWELLAHRRLFTGADEHAILTQVQNATVPDLGSLVPDLPVEITTICHKLLKLRRDDRFQKPTELVHELETLLRQFYPTFDQKMFSETIVDIYLHGRSLSEPPATDLVNDSVRIELLDFINKWTIPPRPRFLLNSLILLGDKDFKSALGDLQKESESLLNFPEPDETGSTTAQALYELSQENENAFLVLQELLKLEIS